MCGYFTQTCFLRLKAQGYVRLLYANLFLIKNKSVIDQLGVISISWFFSCVYLKSYLICLQIYN